MILRSPVQASAQLVDNIVAQWGKLSTLSLHRRYLHFIFHAHLSIALIDRRPIHKPDHRREKPAKPATMGFVSRILTLFGLVLLAHAYATSLDPQTTPED
jgi:hypothetical protein